MRYASVFYRDYAENSLFKPGTGENNGEFYLPYAKLRERFLTLGIELNTPDINEGRKVTFELHINCRRQNPGARAYVYLYENPLIRPLNRNRDALARYTKWFTWDRELLNDPKAIQLPYPNILSHEVFRGPESRPLFLTLVASNKALAIRDCRDQYQERVRILDWYERNAPDSFHLYGKGWNRPAAIPGKWGRVFNQSYKILSRFLPFRSPYRTWRGSVNDKIELLSRARFCLAHENCRDLPGYITEKLFDCFRAGCIPIYAGPSDVQDIIPQICFIDARRFKNPAQMHEYLVSINDSTFRTYQSNIHDFLRSDKAKPFSTDYFVDTLVEGIFKDLL